MASDIRIGTSGWNYSDWKGVLYPEKLRATDFLSHYAAQFATVEVNYSFYRLPSSTTYERWAKVTPETFSFALKLSRYITHIKRLRGIKGAFRSFVNQADPLGAKRGPILVQLPPSFDSSDTNRSRLHAFLDATMHADVRIAVELRHNSWFVPAVYDLLANADASLVIANSERYPNPPESTATASFVYFRFHGPRELFASSYTRSQLTHFAEIMRRHCLDGRDVYAYFNNDYGGYAVQNARLLADLLNV